MAEIFISTGRPVIEIRGTANAGSGNVTSINVVGGTTGLTTSGGPITSSGVITLGGTLIAANGGTGFATYTAGDILIANSSTTLSRVQPGGIGSILISQGAGIMPVWLSLIGALGVFNGALTGTINGINTVFTTASNFTTGKTRVYLNGLRQKLGAGDDYTETAANQITFTNAPQVGDTIIIDYI